MKLNSEHNGLWTDNKRIYEESENINPFKFANRKKVPQRKTLENTGNVRGERRISQKKLVFSGK